MLVLFETPAGYAFFKLLDEKKLSKTEDLYHDFETPEAASKIVKLKHFEKFMDTTEALAATTAAVEGKLSKGLKKTLKKLIGKDLQDQLLVADAKLGNAIKDKLNLSCLSNTSVQELMRCIRSQMDGLLAGLPKKEMAAMALGLAHSLSRYKLKFSPDKIDTMIVQAVCLLDDLDKELNNYIMRCREWYGWHFPELGKIVTDNIAFVKTIKTIGTRENTSSTDLSDILPEEVELKLREAAEISMGTEISEDDILNIRHLCDQVIDISSYRAQLYDYLKARMMAIAPNLTVLVGDLVGARLISHAGYGVMVCVVLSACVFLVNCLTSVTGKPSPNRSCWMSPVAMLGGSPLMTTFSGLSLGSLINLAKHPASTLQILGAEKALFRALKTKRDTPKYGLIYHSQIVGMSSTKNKGKISRMLAAKASLATRVDALGEDSTSIELGAEHKVKVENRLRLLEEGNLRSISGTGKAKARFEKYHSTSRSPSTRKRLHTVMEEMVLPVLELIQFVDTRWSSEYNMLSRLHAVRKAVGAELANSENNIEILTEVEWKQAAGIVEVLGPLADATKEINKALKSRFSFYDSDPIFCPSMLCDPRFRGVLIDDMVAVNTLAIEVKKLSDKSSLEPNVKDEHPSCSSSSSGLWSSFDSIPNTTQPAIDNNSEVKDYLNEPRVPISGGGKRVLENTLMSPSEVRQYSAADDSTLPSSKRKFSDSFPDTPSKVLIEEIGSTETQDNAESKKKKKKKKLLVEVKVEEDEEQNTTLAADSEVSKKKKKKPKEESNISLEVDKIKVEGGKKKKKRKHDDSQEAFGDGSFGISGLFASTSADVEEAGEGKKKRKKIKLESTEESVGDNSFAVSDMSASTSTGDIKIKKEKKKRKSALVEEVDQSLVVTPSKKEKKKKKSLEQSQGEASHEEYQEVTGSSSEKKKKKKKSKTSE
uniref:Nop domain-containing protein n=2 Tax=Timema TaxID=61471 RepID=A0A7R9FXE7_TIMSH|nr:unnamed protein product [Timema shepardi]